MDATPSRPLLTAAHRVEGRERPGSSTARPLPRREVPPLSLTSEPDYTKIEAALNAYGWTSGETRARYGRRDRYDTLGMMLRYAGVPPDEVERSGYFAWHRFGLTLVREYGLRDEVDCYLILQAGDSARTHADAIDRVLRALRGDMTAVNATEGDWISGLVENRVFYYRPPRGR